VTPATTCGEYSGIAANAAVFGLAAATVAGAMAFRQPDRFEARGVMAVVDPAGAALPEQLAAALQAATLLPTAERHGLYRQAPAPAPVEQFRRDISIQVVEREVFGVAYTGADGRQAQRVAADLMNQIAGSGDQTAARFRVLDLPAEPTQAANRFRVAHASLAGLGGGLLAGALLGLFRRRKPV